MQEEGLGVNLVKGFCYRGFAFIRFLLVYQFWPLFFNFCAFDEDKLSRKIFEACAFVWFVSALFCFASSGGYLFGWSSWKLLYIVAFFLPVCLLWYPLPFFLRVALLNVSGIFVGGCGHNFSALMVGDLDFFSLGTHLCRVWHWGAFICSGGIGLFTSFFGT